MTLDVKIKIGPAGWSYDDWRGIVYPEPKPKNFCESAFLAVFFNTIEINSTFYRVPEKRFTERWVKNIEFNPNFKYTVKLHQQYTHKRAGFSTRDIAVFRSAVDIIYDNQRLGALLIQFPWSFKKNDDSLDYIKKLTDAFSPYPCVVEVRHGDWIDPDILADFKQKNIGFANIDQPVIGKSVPLTKHVTSNVSYFRLHGRNYQNWFKQGASSAARYDYLYNDTELASWVNNIHELAENSLETYIVFNNHFRGQAIVNSFQLISKLTNERQNVPSQLLSTYPQLLPISRKKNGFQQSLF
ncbi:DUF72 domain-containing protein [candidate division KSB1 bacterium]|nr:DUF72 domain-containing protein [candidate division KSB1 bacterium]